ncbi:MutH/Sau3AI family endonuclease [Thomasclavelia cocleata]|uniref:MutH/Sau3AI family endonuclease n=1 Tax=Thomasclavelia cocleata TaxID=69824 RepID=UPI00258F354C|nr:MutH/Sau3AI family endonuclease [Thomasclavelia cocleata]
MSVGKIVEHIFTKAELIKLLENALKKTLGEIDVSGDFERTIKNPKITGIAGDVVEHSILGYPSDSNQNPDIVVDGIETEVKTTGIRYSKIDSKKGKLVYEAKEPMSITAVSPDKIVREEFDNSNFWHKLKNLLLIYYHYDSNTTVNASKYSDFYLRGYEFHQFSEEDKLRLMADWMIVHDFIKDLQKDYENPALQYHRLSSELRDKLVYIDTAPKWPNPPRFRLKRNFVSKLVRNHFGESLEQLPQVYNGYSDVDAKCHQLTEENKGKNIYELLTKYNIPFNDITKVSKSICEQIIIKMFGGKATSLNKIEMFNNFNIIGKTITLTNKGARTEDMKLFPIDFAEWCDENSSFEDSIVNDYFLNHQFLCIIFKEVDAKTSKEEFWKNEFIGFKRVFFDDVFIQQHVFPMWNDIRKLINENLLEEKVCIRKETNEPIINPCGTIKTEINFPKSKDNLVFVRGSGVDSTYKNLELNGIKMYRQYIWIKGKYIVDKISKIKLL